MFGTFLILFITGHKSKLVRVDRIKNIISVQIKCARHSHMYLVGQNRFLTTGFLKVVTYLALCSFVLLDFLSWSRVIWEAIRKNIAVIEPRSISYSYNKMPTTISDDYFLFEWHHCNIYEHVSLLIIMLIFDRFTCLFKRKFG